MVKNASETLAEAAVAALSEVDGLTGIYEGLPVQAASPHAVVETGPETDWSHKSGVGREVRIAITLRGRGERPALLRGLAAEAEAAIEALGGEIGGWRVVTLRFVRSRLLAGGRGDWATVSEYRARLLKI